VGKTQSSNRYKNEIARLAKEYGKLKETVVVRGGVKGRVHARPLGLTFADFFLLGSSIAFNRFSARLMVWLESRFEMLVFVTRCNIGAMGRCISIPIRTSLQNAYYIGGATDYGRLCATKYEYCVLSFFHSSCPLF
jgi:hypothetical protein